jgi:hypothetical protein
MTTKQVKTSIPFIANRLIKTDLLKVTVWFGAGHCPGRHTFEVITQAQEK